MRWVLLVVVLAGCREGITGPEPPVLDLAPRIAGTWTGTFDGRLRVVGVPPDVVLRGTFLVTFEVSRLGADFGYTGRVQRGVDGATNLYDCLPESVMVDLDRRVSMPCRQGTQFGETPVLRVEAQADTAFETLTGVVVAEETYPITLTKSK